MIRISRAVVIAFVLTIVAAVSVRAAGLSVTVTPNGATRMVTYAHNVIATVVESASGVPLAGATVNFSITGANAGAVCMQGGTNSQISDTNGNAACTYTGTVAGADTIAVSASYVGDTVVTGSGSATATWVNPAIALAPSGGLTATGLSHGVTATVSVPANATGTLDAAKVTFTVSGANPRSATEITTTAGTGGNRVATFTYTGTNAGRDTITAKVTQTNNVATSGDTTSVVTDWFTVTVSKTITSAVKNTATVYNWAGFQKTVVAAFPTLAAGQSSSFTYTITGTRSQSGNTTTYTMSGDITLTNNGSVAQQVTVVDQAQTTTGAARGSAFTSTTTVAASSTATVSYSVSFASAVGDTNTTAYQNHVDVYGGASASGPVIASTTVPASFIATTSTVGASALVTDALNCPASFTCGSPINPAGDGTVPPPGGGLRSVTGSFSFSYQRTITNNTSSCGTATIIDTATLTPGGNSQQPPLAGSATITNNAGTCPPPSIVNVTPNIGSTSGGDAVTINGHDFVIATGLHATFGGVDGAINMATSTPTSIQVTTPASAPGVVNVVVTNPDGQSATATNAFTYLCTFGLSPVSANVTAAANSYSVNVTASNGCSWTATAPAGSFVRITSGSSGSGAGTVSYHVAENFSGASRSTTLTIAGNNFVVTQDPALTASLLSMVATASASNVMLSWPAIQNATSYEIQRSSNGSSLATIAATPTPGFNDTTVTIGLGYLYRVRAIGSSGVIGSSNVDLAVPFSYTYAPVSGVVIHAVDILELRQAAAAAQIALDGTPWSFSDATLMNVAVQARHTIELRTAVNGMRGSIGLAPLNFTDPSIMAGTTLVRAAHVTELRSGLQ